MDSTSTIDGTANVYLHLLLGFAPVEPVQLGIVVARAPPPVLCKASHGPTQLHHTHMLYALQRHNRCAYQLCLTLLPEWEA